MRVTGSGADTGFFIDGNRMFNYGSFSTLQTLSGSANVSASILIEHLEEAEGVSIVSGSRITFSHTGVYNIQFSAQLYTQTAASVHIWYKLNGSNIIDSGTRVGPTQNGDYLVPSWNFVKSVTSGSYIELVWQSTQSNTTLQYIAPTGNIPACPSMLVSVTQIR